MIEVTVPYWGDPTLMRQTIDSVTAQTSPHWRLTIIDDDYPGDAIETYVSWLGDDRISYRRKPENEGLVANFRSCVAVATAPLMMMLGADDRLLPCFVEDVLRASEETPAAAMFQPGVRVIDADGEPSLPLADRVKQRLLRPRSTGPLVLSGEPLAASLLHGNWLYWPSLVFRTPVIQSIDFRDDYEIILDLDLVLRLVERGEQLAVLPGTCFEYRRHAASESSTSLLDGRRFRGEKDFFQEAAERSRALGWRRAERAARLHLTSRLHALTLAPAAIRRDPRALTPLLRHALGH